MVHWGGQGAEIGRSGTSGLAAGGSDVTALPSADRCARHPSRGHRTASAQQVIGFHGGGTVDPEQVFAGVFWQSGDIGGGLPAAAGRRRRYRRGHAHRGDQLRLHLRVSARRQRLDVRHRRRAQRRHHPHPRDRRPGDQRGAHYLFGFGHDSGFFTEVRLGSGNAQQPDGGGRLGHLARTDARRGLAARVSGAFGGVHCRRMAERSRTITWDDPMTMPGRAAAAAGLEMLRRVAAGELPSTPMARLMDIRLTVADPAGSSSRRCRGLPLQLLGRRARRLRRDAARLGDGLRDLHDARRRAELPDPRTEDQLREGDHPGAGAGARHRHACCTAAVRRRWPRGGVETTRRRAARPRHDDVPASCG